MNEFEEYKSWVNEIEKKYADYAYKSINLRFLDRTTFDEYYSKIFTSDDIFTKQRNRYRTPFQLERDRILYSSLFQRLVDKTQLFTSEKISLAENRQSHTLKVVQISRSIARGLKLNEDLVEAIGLGHDIGHSPFAHIGEEALEEWLMNKLAPRQGERTLIKPDLPILNNIMSDSWDKSIEYFTFGNDPKEKLFMHGRQSFRLLVLKRKIGKREHLKFSRPVMYGIWRHSINNFDTDKTFYFKKNIAGKDIELSGREDLTLEAQVVRYADDIAWVVSDLEEGIYNKVLKKEYISNIIDEIEDSTLAGRLSDIFNPDIPKIVELYTVFIANIINHNLETLQNSEKPQEIKLNFSSDIKDIFYKLKGLIKKYLYDKYFMARGSQVNKARIKGLCDWYYNNSQDFLTEIKLMMKRPDFPIRIPVCKKCEEYSDYELYEDLIKNDKIYRISVIIDFVSSLTDHEVFRLSETMPIEEDKA